MPTAPSNPRYAAEEEDDSELTPLPPPEDRVADTPRYTPAQAQPAAAQPALGTTGGIIPTHGYAPGEDTSRPKGAPPDYSPDITQRRTQINAEIDRRKRAAFDTARPFAPSADYRGPSQFEYQQLGRQEETGYQQQALQARRTEVATRRAALDTAKSEQMARNAQRQQDFLASGQKHYRDPYGEIQPILEAGTNRPLYHPSQWEDGGMHPDTGEPTMVKRDQYGQRQYKTPPITANAADPADSNLYYDFGNGDLRSAGDITSLMTHPNPRVAKLARVADFRRKEAERKEALQPASDIAALHKSKLDEAKVLRDSNQAEIDRLTDIQLVSPSPENEKTRQNLEAHNAFLDEQIKPYGPLARNERDARLKLKLFESELKHAQYNDAVAFKAQELRDKGIDPETDFNYRALVQTQKEFGGELSNARSQVARDAVMAQKFAPGYQPPPEESAADESTQAPIRGLGEAIGQGGGGILKGAASFLHTNVPMDPETTGFGPDPMVLQEMQRRAAQTGTQKLEEIQNDPLYKWGKNLEGFTERVTHLTPKEREGFWTKAGQAAGGFVLPAAAGLPTSGLGAPATMMLQSAGNELERIYKTQIDKGVDPDTAADFAIRRSLISGAVQGALFQVLPPAIRKLGGKAIDAIAESALGKILSDKIGANAATRFVAGRVEQGAEGAALGAATGVTGNVAAERPTGEGVAKDALGQGLVQAVFPGPRGYFPKPSGSAPTIGPGGEPKPPGTEPVAGQPTELPPISPNENQPTGTPAGGSQPPLQPNEVAGGGPPAKPGPRGANANPDGPGEVLNQSGVAGGAGVAESPSGTATLGSQPVKLQVRRAKTGEMVEVEMPAAKAADRLEKHMTNLRSLIDCLAA